MPTTKHQRILKAKANLRRQNNITRKRRQRKMRQRKMRQRKMRQRKMRQRKMRQRKMRQRKMRQRKMRQRKMRQPVKYALIIGINYLNTDARLDGCINDAYNMSKFLQKQGYASKNIVILTDTGRIKPTKKNIITQLVSMLKRTKSKDRVFVFYSGHGSYIADMNRDEMDGRDECIIPLDALNNSENIIVDDELNNIFSKFVKSGVRVFGVVDACFSGTAFDLPYNYSQDGNNSYSNPVTHPIKGQVVMLSGSSDLQYSEEIRFFTRHGIVTEGALTNAFIKIYTRLQSAQRSFSYSQLARHVRGFIRKRRLEQVPNLSSSNKLDINSAMTI